MIYVLVALVLAGAVYNLLQVKSQDAVTATPETSPTLAPTEASLAPATQNAPSNESAENLARVATDAVQTQEARRKAVYDLTQMGAAALPSLAAIAAHPVVEAKNQDPHSADQIKQSFEASLRVSAIEALDELALNPNNVQAVKAAMLAVLKTQKHRSLTLLAQLSLSGIESGQPGKVKRAIDAMVEETDKQPTKEQK